jgi:hypothetical protein
MMWALFVDECKKSETGRDFLGSLPKNAMVTLAREPLRSTDLDRPGGSIHSSGFFLIGPVPEAGPTSQTLLFGVDNSKVILPSKKRRERAD